MISIREDKKVRKRLLSPIIIDKMPILYYNMCNKYVKFPVYSHPSAYPFVHAFCVLEDGTELSTLRAHF